MKPHRLLFPDDVSCSSPPAISGLTYLANFITEQQESELVHRIDAESWNTSWERRRQLYGGSYGRSSKAVRPIPEWGQALSQRIWQAGIAERAFDHMLINEYLPGQGIALHCDYEPFDRTVVSLSLLAPCVMDFRRLSDQAQEALLLEPRSLLVLRDEARYEWQHGIARRKNDRWCGTVLPRRRRLSVTFRSLKQPVDQVSR